ncbi:MAG: C25 family cysteine peptidase [Vicinamibacteria bacterium]|nr:C25 family cysteine peptidase [Vicinamibacteria bacterium]
MQTSSRAVKGRILWALALAVLCAPQGLAQGVLSIEIVNGYNLIVDSNVTAPSTYAPGAAYIGAQVCNTGNATLDNVTAYVGNYQATRSFTATTTAGSRTITATGVGANAFAPTTEGGLLISGSPNIPAGTTLSAIASATSATLSAPATVSGSLTVTLTAAPGVFPVTTFGADPNPLRFHLANTGPYSLTLEVGSGSLEDGTRYVGSLAAGECRIQYWLFSYPQCVNVSGAPQYPPCDVSIAGGIKAEDDLSLDYDIWATTTTAIASPTVVETGDFTMRNEISASANKIWPNTASKVPDEYLAAIQGVVGWGTLGPDGQPLTAASAVYPGQRVITTQGIWYDLGNVGHGFDNNGDLIPDQNAWLQPVGDAASFDTACFRMVNVYGIVIVKLKDGGELLIPFQNQLYHENLPDNTGVVGLVYYQYIATREGCAANMTPYQEAASGYDNEKFSADYGLNLGLQSGEFDTDLTFSKTDGVTTVAPGGTLTYTISATNSTGVALGAPDLGTPLVFRESIPTGTTYVASSADNTMVAPTGTGTYSQGFTDVDGNLDPCPINYNITSSSWLPFYSNDGGFTWVLTPEPSGVTDIRWLLQTTIALDGSHDRSACVAPNGVYDDGTLDTSLPPGKTVSVQFQVTVDTNPSAVICNTARVGFGPALSNVEATDCTLVSGPNSIAGRVFEDDGGDGTATYGNGLIDNATEVGIGNGTTGTLVRLYYDANADGLLDEGDLYYDETFASATGAYSFTLLPDGNFIVVAKKYDGVTVTTTAGSMTVTSPQAVFTSDDIGKSISGNGIPLGATIAAVISPTEIEISSNATVSNTVIALVAAGTSDAATEFLAGRVTNADLTTGWGNTTYDPNLALTTDSGILKLHEDLTTVSLAISIDLDHSNALNQSLTTTELTAINFGFAPPFELTKTVAATTVDEGDLFDYTIVLTNRLPSVGVQGPSGCQYTAWATTGSNGTPANKEFTNFAEAHDGPNRQVATAYIEGGANRFMYSQGFRLADQAGSITRVEVLVMAYYDGTLDNDRLELQARLAGVDNTLTTINSAAMASYIGPPPDLNPNSAISWDVTSNRPGGGSWTWADDFFGLRVYTNPAKASGADPRTFSMDAVGIRVTTDADCVAGTSTTLDPVPLQDRYDATWMSFVSAVPPPTTVSGSTLQWDNVGPILPGTSTTVTVTMRANDVAGLELGSCATTFAGIPGTAPPTDTLCNLAETAYTGHNVYYADGRLANDDDDKVAVNIQGKGELRGTVFRDDGNTAADGWAMEAASIDLRLANVSVTLFACVKADGVTLETGATNNKTCLTQTGGNSWLAWSTTITDADGAYEFLGLDSGYYIIQVGDTDGDVTTAGSSPFGFTQTAEARDTQTVTGLNSNGDDCLPISGGVTCNSTWGSSTADLNVGFNLLNGAAEETINGIDFGYFSTEVLIYGNVWHDVDGDATRDTGDGDLDNFTVQLYTDPNGDGDPADGALVSTDVSDADGNYAFTVNILASTNYTIVVTPETLPNNVWAETDEATVTGGSVLTPLDLDNRIRVTVAPGATSGSHDFGYTLDTTSDIGDTVYIDFDADGIQDPTENGIPNVTVWLYEDVDRDGTIDAGVDDLLQTDVTDAFGEYLFTGLPEGNYIVQVDTTDPDFPSDVTATADPDIFAGTIGNYVWYDNDNDGVQDATEAGIPGVVVLLWAADANVGFNASQDTLIAATTTNINGNYLFTGLPAGSYYVTVDETTLPVTLSRSTPVAANSNLITLASSTASDLTADFGYYAAQVVIGSRVWHDTDGDGVQDAGEIGLPGVDITISGASCATPCTATTDEAGYWTLAFNTAGTALGNGTYTMTVDTTDLPSGVTATTGTTGTDSVTIAGLVDNVNLTTGGIVTTDFDFGYRYATGSPTGSITGSVFLDADGDDLLDSGEAMASVTVNLLDENGYVIATTTTDVTGAYAFTGVFIGDYAVEVLASYGTRYSVLFLSSTSGFPNLNVAYDATQATTADDQSSVAVDGVHDNLLQDFGYERFLGSVGDTVYWDANENGTQDVGEPGISGVLVSLYDCTWADDGDFIFESAERSCTVALDTVTTTVDDPLTTADEGGKYLFSNLDTLATNHYYVVGVDTASLPGPYVTSPGPGVYLTADPETDGLVCTSLTPSTNPPSTTCDNFNLVQVFRGGLNYLGADFGYQIASLPNYAKLGDHVWIDTDGDGTLDVGEPGIPNISVWIDADGDGVLDWSDANSNGEWDSGEGERWTVTDTDGYYLFTGLADGSYQVRVLTSDADWPSGLPTTPTFEVRSTNLTSLDSIAIATISGGAVTAIDDGHVGNTDTCTNCDLNVDFGYRYAGTNSLSGTVCIDAPAEDGNCGRETASVTTTSGSATVTSAGLFSSDMVGSSISGTGIPAGATITAFTDANTVTISAPATADGTVTATINRYSGTIPGDESPMSGISVYLYRWTDTDADNVAWATDGTLDAGDTFVLMGSTSTDANGDYSFTNVPDDVVIVFGVNPAQSLLLNTTQANTAVEDGGLSQQVYNGQTIYDSTLVASIIRQALKLAPDADNVVRNVDYAFDGTYNGAITYDYGDLPNDTYGATVPDYNMTLLRVGGARHLVGSVFLGTGVTADTDGFDSIDAAGEVDAVGNDGVALVGGQISPGTDGGALDVFVTNPTTAQAWLVGWMDFNKDGDFADEGERIVQQAVVAGQQYVFFDVPATLPEAASATYFARFRIFATEPLLISATGTSLSSTFEPLGGEVEDYAFALSVTAAVVSRFEARDTARGMALEWETASEVGTLGWFLHRYDDEAGRFVPVHERRLPSVRRRQGGLYRYVDETATPGQPYTYQLVEVELSGRTNVYGPYRVDTRKTDASAGAPVVQARGRRLDAAERETGFASVPKGPSRPADKDHASSRQPPSGRAGSVKLEVGARGLYYVSLADLAAWIGRPVDYKRLVSPQNPYALVQGGNTIAFDVTPDRQGLVFFGQELDSIYTAHNVYGWGAGTGRGVRMAARNEMQPTPASGAELFGRRVHAEVDQIQADDAFNEPEADTFLWDFVFWGYDPAFTFDADGARAGEATLSIRVKGLYDTPTSPDHVAAVKINGQQVGEVVLDGLQDRTIELPFEGSVLVDGANVLELSADIDVAPNTVFMVDSFEIRYPSVYRAAGDQIEARADGNAAVLLSGFSRPDIFVYDITDPLRPVQVNGRPRTFGDGTFGVELTPPSPADTVYFAATPAAFQAPARIWENVPSSLATDDPGAEYVILAPAALKATAQRLADYRSDLRTIVIDLEDVYDEFNHGIPSPHAIKAFFDHTWRHWSTAPRYALLVGDGSVDYKDVWGLGQNLAPTMRINTPSGLVPSDAWFGDLDQGQPGPEVVIGRLPAADPAELDQMIDKVLAREASLGSPWQEKTVLVAEVADHAGAFPDDSERVAAADGGVQEKLYLSPAAGVPAVTTTYARTQLLAAFTNGAGFISYLGHGGYDRIANETLLHSNDVVGMTNLDQPVMTAMTCVVNDFAQAGDASIGELLMRQPGGGAAALWGASALSQNEFAVLLAEGFYASITAGGGDRLGDAVRESVARYDTTGGPKYLGNGYVLLGDPAMRVR